MEQDDPLETLFSRARQYGVPISAICQRAGIDPTTPSRWKRGKNGANYRKLAQMRRALAEIIEERGAEVAA